MPLDILMPALSPTMEEGTLARWLVKTGDQVKPGDVLAEIETDKATMELEATEEGVIGEIMMPAGSEEVKVNTLLARFAPAGSPEAGGAQVSVAAAEAPATLDASDSPIAVVSPTASVNAPAGAQPAATSTLPGAAPQHRPGDGFASDASISPLARRIAEQTGVSLAGLQGSGGEGRILLADVRPTKPVASAAEAWAPVPPPKPVSSLEELGIAEGAYDLIALDGMRRTVAARMSESFRDVPHFPLTVDILIDEFLAARSRINALLERDGSKVSINDMVIKAAAVALMRAPEANASYSPEGIAMHHHADIAVAVAVEGGLITPILRHAERKGVATIAAEMKDLSARARARKLRPEEFQGGTFSISNLGMFGVKSFSSILNAPQGAILSVGAGERRPVVKDDKLDTATVMTVTLTCDHRAMDGASGARFLDAFRSAVEDPLLLLV